MATSTEKVLVLIEHLQNMEDAEITDALSGVPFSAPMIRGALLLIADQVPLDAGELDAFLDQAGEFILSLRSDSEREPAQGVATGG